MVKKYSKDTKVTWKWGKGSAEGTVKEIHEASITRKIKGSNITRKGSKDNPAYLIEQSDGQSVLKLHTELNDK